MTCRPIRPSDAAEWLRMRNLLWPHSSSEESVARHFENPGEGVVLVVETEPESCYLLGFAEISIRRDYVEGTKISPLPFLEGWFVDPAHRRKGAGRALLLAAEAWSVRHGYAQFASNAEASNALAIAAHLECGFFEVSRTVNFVKTLQPPPGKPA